MPSRQMLPPHKRMPKMRTLRIKGKRPKHPLSFQQLFRLLICTLLICVLFFFGRNIYINDQRIIVDKVNITLPNLPRQLEGYTILHLSDLHDRWYGKEQEKLIAALEKAKFDAVLISGDMVNQTEKGYNSAPFLKLLDALSVYEKPIYFVNGNHDPILKEMDPYGYYRATPYLAQVEEHGAHLLELPVPLARTEDRSIWLVNSRNMLDADLESAIKQLDEILVDLRTSGLQAQEMILSIAEHEQEKKYLMQLKALRDQIKPEDTVIELTHVPYLPQAKYPSLAIPAEIQMQVDLILAGHFHGGQIRLPLLGAVYVPEVGLFPDNHYVKGLMTVDFVTQYINAGLGASRINLRLNNPPQVALLTLSSRLA